MSLFILWLFELTISLCLDEIERFTNLIDTLSFSFPYTDEPNAPSLEWITQQEDCALLSLQIITDILYSAHVEECFVLDHRQPLVVNVWDLD